MPRKPGHNAADILRRQVQQGRTGLYSSQRLFRLIFTEVAAHDGLTDVLRREPAKFRRAVHINDAIATADKKANYRFLRNLRKKVRGRVLSGLHFAGGGVH